MICFTINVLFLCVNNKGVLFRVIKLFLYGFVILLIEIRVPIYGFVSTCIFVVTIAIFVVEKLFFQIGFQNFSH